MYIEKNIFIFITGLLQDAVDQLIIHVGYNTALTIFMKSTRLLPASPVATTGIVDVLPHLW